MTFRLLMRPPYRRYVLARVPHRRPLVSVESHADTDHVCSTTKPRLAMVHPEDDGRSNGPHGGKRRSKLRILHLIVRPGHSNAQYNEHCLPLAGERDITICSFFPASVDVPQRIRLFEGDGTVRGFAAALDDALVGRPYDIVHAHAPGTGAMLMVGNLLRGRSMSDAVLTVHNSRQSFSARNQLVLVPLFAAFPTIVFCSHAALESFPRIVRSVGAGTIDVVQNGVDIDRIDRALAVDLPPRETGFRVVSVGRLIQRKDPITLLRAFGLVSAPRGRLEDRLVYVGDGVERSRVLEEARSWEIEPIVTLTGTVDRDDVYREVAASDLVVSTSLREGLPVSVLEAMACARPVVISDIPPHREIAASADFIPLVAPGDVAGFAREIRRSKGMSTEERASIGRRCRDLVETRFDLTQMHHGYDRVYGRVTALQHRGMREHAYIDGGSR